MTTEELSKLSPEEKRVKIAEICGWKLSKERDRFGNQFYEKNGEFRRVGVYPVNVSPLPDFLNSLDAMHEAIMSQPPAFRKAMRATLWALTDQMSAHFADANTVADAFLLTT